MTTNTVGLNTNDHIPTSKPSHKPEMIMLITKKTDFFQEVIQKTILHIQRIKMFDILGVSEITKCINTLYDLCKTLKNLVENKCDIPIDTILTRLQDMNNDLSSILKIYGTESLDDLLCICFGGSINIPCKTPEKFSLLKKYFHPVSYSVLQNDKYTNAENPIYCYDIANTSKFHLKVYGIKVNIYSSQLKKTLCIVGFLDDIIIEFLNNKYIDDFKMTIQQNLPDDDIFHNSVFERYLSCLELKDYLVYDDETHIYGKYGGYLSQVSFMKQKHIQQIVKEFISIDLFEKRMILIQLLINSSTYDNQYLAYLLYDILSNDTTSGSVDTQEQTILFDSFPWSIKQYFRDAMKNTIQYTNELTEFDVNKIPLEQQICLMNAPDSVKEKAISKLKEMKSKSEDSGSKAQNYLKGLLKIPFSVYKKEKILTVMNDIKIEFKELFHKKHEFFSTIDIKPKDQYTSLEIMKCVKQHQQYFKNKLLHDKNALLDEVKKINVYIKDKNIPYNKIKYSNKSISLLRQEVNNFLQFSKEGYQFTTDFSKIEQKFELINSYMLQVKKKLDKSVYGHDKPKKQIERIIGQWINGEQNGYCFGFEGPAGVGKTSLAKYGLSNCLIDENGESRPFAMIQMGGDSNGSTIHGHNYTYVGSTWGNIVQILIDKKCMNPIIFIDEVDKISKTENGKEIVGILIHLLDYTQNDCFQDKYFSGIDLDLSKALFILSYNDVDSIDRILLDRIHRVKFSSLSLEEKLIISKEYLLPEIYKKMGLETVIHFDDCVIKYIIDTYTLEPGVRKLKEVLFEIVGEINLDILTNNQDYLSMVFPLDISVNDVKTKYFKEKQKMKHKQIHTLDCVGIINGLWANALGFGGVIPIQATYFPSTEKNNGLKLTGMQGDVMKESMNVAQTLAWNLTNKQKQEEEQNNLSIHSIHIHCPEGSVPKDGPSAGAAITTAIYSLLSKRKINHLFAITGEISLDGCITEIGGLDVKILGGIKAGVKYFIFPTENKKDFDEFMVKYKDNEILQGIQFYQVNRISEVFELIFV
jgi:endopeptidase La